MILTQLYAGKISDIFILSSLSGCLVCKEAVQFSYSMNYPPRKVALCGDFAPNGTPLSLSLELLKSVNKARESESEEFDKRSY